MRKMIPSADSDLAGVPMTRIKKFELVRCYVDINGIDQL